ncbi:hypothetical protein MRX96_006512 [Rhipicephalus microplus]
MGDEEAGDKEKENGAGDKDDDDDDDDAGGDDGAPKGKRPPDSIMVQRKSARGSQSSAGSSGKTDSDAKSTASMIITIGGLLIFAAVVLGVVGFIVYKITQSTEAGSNGSVDDGGDSVVSFFNKIGAQKVRRIARSGAQQFLVFAEAPRNPGRRPSPFASFAIFVFPSTTSFSAMLAWKRLNTGAANIDGNPNAPLCNVSPCSGLTVVAFIHEGGLRVGGNADRRHDSSVITAQEHVAVVVPNYQLGMFGFASRDIVGAARNPGLLDIVMALDWVREGIAVFCWNAKNVVLFGSGWGSYLAGLFIVSPKLKSYSRTSRMILGSVSPLLKSNHEHQTEEHWTGFFIAAGCGHAEESTTLECLRNATASSIAEAQVQFPGTVVVHSCSPTTSCCRNIPRSL